MKSVAPEGGWAVQLSSGWWVGLLAIALGILAGHGRLEAAGPARTVNVAAAADLRFALDEVITAFKKVRPDITVQASYGASGNLFGQLSNRAPFDLFLSADVGYPEQLIAAGLVVEEKPFVYATGHLVLWVSNASPIDVGKLGMKALLEPSIRKIALANPKHAPYGRAAEAALKQLGVYDRVKDRLVLGDNVAQTAQFVQSGAADIGLIAKSLTLAPTMQGQGRHWEVPASAHPKLLQGGVTLKWAKDAEAARAFKAYFTGPEARPVLHRYGFALPE